ncbi:hypothetical protein SAMN05421688_2842 [Poseidonocella pacifica]|uniref:Uncharacterized protein n=1 Tax=Poseidonocella pacifica TaxID=871651 RepID=A0A1I0Y5M8_9RHOB|nr:hypothetical protein SAMN05421688_2842 [Poseidonocella pacifica]
MAVDIANPLGAEGALRHTRFTGLPSSIALWRARGLQGFCKLGLGDGVSCLAKTVCNLFRLGPIRSLAAHRCFAIFLRGAQTCRKRGHWYADLLGKSAEIRFGRALLLGACTPSEREGRDESRSENRILFHL